VAAEEYLQEGLTIHQELGDMAAAMESCGELAVVAREQGDYPRARFFYERFLITARGLGDERGSAIPLYGLGYTAYLEGDLATAQSLLEEALAILRGHEAWNDLSEIQFHLAWIEAHLGEVADARGDLVAARQHLEDSLAIFHSLRNPGNTAF